MMRELEPSFTRDRLKFADFASDLPLGLRTHYVFHTQHFVTQSSKIIPKGGSDHYLVVSELKIDEQSHPSVLVAGVDSNRDLPPSQSPDGEGSIEDGQP